MQSMQQPAASYIYSNTRWKCWLRGILSPVNLAATSNMGNRYQMLLFVSFHLLLVAARTQGQDSQLNITGYTCSSSPSLCSTYAFYKAQAPDFLNLLNISNLFEAKISAIADASNLPPDTLSLVDGQPLLVPISCGCMRNYSQANITYAMIKGDTFYGVSTRKFENLTTYQAVEVANPTLIPTDVEIGALVTFPIRCKCPSKAQLRNGTKMLITYLVRPGDSLSSISQKLGADPLDLKSENGMNSTLDPYTTILVPVSKKPQFSFAPLPSPSSSPSSSTTPPSPTATTPSPSPAITPPTPTPSPSPAITPPTPTTSSPSTSPTPSSATSPPASEGGLHRGVLIEASLNVARSFVCIYLFVFCIS